MVEFWIVLSSGFLVRENRQVKGGQLEEKSGIRRKVRRGEGNAGILVKVSSVFVKVWMQSSTGAGSAKIKGFA